MKALLVFALSLAGSSVFALDIQVPPEIRDPGSIQLSGTPGANQKDDYVICGLSRDKNGRFNADGEASCTRHKLGDDIHVPAGAYLVGYSGMSVIVEVTNNRVPLTLNPLQLKKVDGTFSFTLYRELGDKDEQLKVALERWVGHNKNLRTEVWQCDPKEKRPLDAAAKTYCNVMRNLKGPEDLLKVMKFDELGGVFAKFPFSTDQVVNGEWLISADYGPRPADIYSVGSGNDGDFIAVLPGVYAAQFWSSAGHMTKQPNIVVK